MLSDTDSAVKDAQKRIDYTSQDLNAVLLQLGLMAGDARRVERMQQSYWLKVGPRTIALLDRGNSLLSQTQGNEQQVSANLVGVLEAAHRTLDSTNQLVEDKDIKDILANLNKSTTYTVDATQHLDATAVHFDNSAAKLEHKLDQMLKPRSLVKTILLDLIRVAADLGTIYRSY